MAFEADRMTGLVLTDEIVAPERDVVLEERRMHCDADPGAQLNEAVQATLFTHHPYGMPIIGWGHEIEGLGREDALAYYRRFYTPENAILIVAGDVDPRRRARSPRLPTARSSRAARRPSASARASRRRSRAALVTVNDEKVEQPNWQRHYLAPSCRTAAPGESEALEVLAHLLGGGQTSLLYRTLVIEEKIAVAAWAYYMARRSTRPASSLRDARARRHARDARRGVRPGARDLPRRRGRRRPRWSAPRRGSSPMRSTPRTASPISRAGTAPRSPPARP